MLDLVIFDSLPSPQLEVGQEYIVSFPPGHAFEVGNGRVRVESISKTDADNLTFVVTIIDGCTTYGRPGATIDIGGSSPFHKSMLPVQDTFTGRLDMSFSDLF